MLSYFCFFFQAEDGIRDKLVTGVQTCALPILELRHFYVAVTRSRERLWIFDENSELNEPIRTYCNLKGLVKVTNEVDFARSEERRVGKECRCWGWRYK